MKKVTIKRIATFLLLAALLTGVFSPSAFAAELPEARDLGFDLDIYANAVYLENLDTGEVIYTKNASQRVHPASTTKIMATALAMSLCSDLEGTVVTVPDDVWAPFEGLNVSHADLRAGEEITMRDLLYCLMLQSANEGAEALAAYYGYDNFMRMMNEKAVALGCTDTHFSSPHGVFAADHYSTAYDLALITKWAMTVPGFMEICSQARYTKPATNMHAEPVTLVSTIEMQDPTSRYYTSYLRGVKTGTTEDAGRCLVSTAEKDGVQYLLVVLGAPMEGSSLVWADANAAFTETRRIYDWAYENLRVRNVLETETVVDEVKLRFASGRDTLLLYPAGAVPTVVRNDAETDPVVRFAYELPESVNAPIEPGDVIATADVFVDERFMGTVNLVAHESIPRNALAVVMDTLSQVLSSTAAKIIYVVLFLFILLYLYYMLVVVPRARKKQKEKLRRKQMNQQQQNNRNTRDRS